MVDSFFVFFRCFGIGNSLMDHSPQNTGKSTSHGSKPKRDQVHLSSVLGEIFPQTINDHSSGFENGETALGTCDQEAFIICAVVDKVGYR